MRRLQPHEERIVETHRGPDSRDYENELVDPFLVIDDCKCRTLRPGTGSSIDRHMGDLHHFVCGNSSRVMRFKEGAELPEVSVRSVVGHHDADALARVVGTSAPDTHNAVTFRFLVDLGPGLALEIFWIGGDPVEQGHGHAGCLEHTFDLFNDSGPFQPGSDQEGVFNAVHLAFHTRHFVCTPTYNPA